MVIPFPIANPLKRERVRLVMDPPVGRVRGDPWGCESECGNMIPTPDSPGGYDGQAVLAPSAHCIRSHRGFPTGGEGSMRLRVQMLRVRARVIDKQFAIELISQLIIPQTRPAGFGSAGAGSLSPLFPMANSLSTTRA